MTLVDWIVVVLILLATGTLAMALPLRGPLRLLTLGNGSAVCLATLPLQQVLPEDWSNVLAAIAFMADAKNSDGSPLPLDTSNQVTVTYKVTATVRVNGELRSGSSLQQMTVRRNITFGLQAASNTTTRFFGEAVAVPIVDDAHLLVTMVGASGYEGVLVSPCFDWRRDGRTEPPSADEVLSNAANFSGSCALAPDRLPFMLAVRDTEEPTGIVSMPPSDLSLAFGADVEFVSLEFSLSEEPLQYRLYEKLRWIDSISEVKYSSGMIEVQGLNGRKSFFYTANILARGAD